jgi:hypothetical protein
LPFDIGKVCYYGGNVAERAAVGNVTDTTTNEQLLLRQPLAAPKRPHESLDCESIIAGDSE